MAALAVVAGAAGLGWFRPVPQDVPPGTLPPDSWSLPSAQSLERSSLAMGTQARRIGWASGASAAGGDAAAGGQSAWTLLGVVLDRGMPAALVRTASKPEVLRIVQGGTLPDGARLIAVERNAVVIESEGCVRRRTVYPSGEQGDSKAADACGTSQGNKEPGQS